MPRLSIFAQGLGFEPSEYPEPVDGEKTLGDRLTFAALVVMSAGVMVILTIAALGLLG